VFAEGAELAVKYFSLAFEALELALAGVGFTGQGRRDRGLNGGVTGLGPGGGRRLEAGLVFEPSEALIEEGEAALDGAGELPIPVAVESCEGGDGLGEAAEVGDEGGDELGEGTPARPGFGEEALQGLFRIVVSQTRGAAGVGEQA